MSGNITLWTVSENGIAYSSDRGATWTQIPDYSGGVWVANGLCGPSNTWKIYTLIGPNSVPNEGIVSYDETGWHSELTGFNTEPMVADWPVRSGMWCNEDDTYVVSVKYADIRERDGPPGTPWTNPVTRFPSAWWHGFHAVHGTPDASAVYAVFTGVAPDAGLYRRDPGTGVWSGVAIFFLEERLLGVYVVSDTEVWIYGEGPSGGTIWKWDGANVTEEFSKSDPFGTLRVTSIYMEPDGSSGWAILHHDDEIYFLRYNGASWSEAQVTDFGDWSTEMTQLEGDLNSARLVLGDGTMVAYNGASWVSFPTSAPFSPEFYHLQYLGPEIVPAPAPESGEVVCGAYGWQPHGRDSQYGRSFCPTPPYLANLDPADGETGVYPDTDIVLDVLDDDGDLNADSVVIEVNDVVVWSGDAQQNGFVVSKTAQSYGLRYVITPPEFLSPGTTVVAAYAEDLA